MESVITWIVPLNSYVEVLSPSTQNVTLQAERIFKEITRSLGVS